MADRPDPDLVARAVAAIDAANAADPVTVVVDGVEWPKEVLHAERMTHWLGVLDPQASAAQLLAARAHHLRRWVSPRSDFPDGRAGYLRWRTAHKRRQVDELRALLDPVGVPPEVVDAALAIVAKDGLRGGDRAAQVQEDALCLVFLELQLDDLAERLGDDHSVEVLRKSAAKMSARGLEATGSVALSERGRRLLATAVSDTDPIES